jgi:hypothetical protein
VPFNENACAAPVESVTVTVVEARGFAGLIGAPCCKTWIEILDMWKFPLKINGHLKTQTRREVYAL